MYTLMREYRYLTTGNGLIVPGEKWRRKRILEQAILPAITEMLTSVKLLYPESDLSGLLDIMEKAVDDDACNT